MSHPFRLGPIIAFTLLWVAGCAHQPEAPSQEQARIPYKAPLPIKETPGMMGDLLVAELAAQRDALGVTQAYYSRVARATNDPAVLEQAARLAAYRREHQEALDLAQRWLRQEPGNPRALEIASLAAVSLGNARKAALHIDRLMAQDPDRALSDLVEKARQLNAEANEPLLEAFSSLVEQYPDQAPLWYARALHRQNQGRRDEALEACDQALDVNPDHQQALMLKGRLLAETGRTEAARKHFRKVVKQFPDQPRARMQYARRLIASERLDKARKQVDILAERFPQSPRLRVSVGLYALEQKAHALARETLTTLLDEGYQPNEMHFYLARIASQAGQPDTAIEHYRAISSGQNRLRGRVQAARLMYQNGRGDEAEQLLQELRARNPDQAPSLYASHAEILRQVDRMPQALDLLDQAIAELPNEQELLYARAMIAERMGRTDQAKADLRRVLEMEPGDAVALNALGYTLADNNQRLDQAREYIQQALEQQPDNPAFLDSKGWLLYREGKPEEALDWLQRAWEQFRDPEVAAHYGEVLWQLNRRDKAREIWQQGVEANPDDHDPIRDAMQRLTGETP